VHDLGDIGASGGEGSGEMSEAARSIADQRVESVDAAVRREASLDDPAVRQGIDIPAGQKQNHSFVHEIRQRSTQQRCQASRPGAFDDALLQLGETQDRQRQRFFAHGHDPIHQW